MERLRNGYGTVMERLWNVHTCVREHVIVGRSQIASPAARIRPLNRDVSVGGIACRPQRSHLKLGNAILVESRPLQLLNLRVHRRSSINSEVAAEAICECLYLVGCRV